MSNHDDREESEIRWKLLASVHDQGAALATAESRLDQAEAGIERAGAGIARLRGILQRLGVSTARPSPTAETRPYLRAEAFAELMQTSGRRVRDRLREQGTVGVHYHKEGRHYIVHTLEAEKLFVGTQAEPPGPKEPEPPPPPEPPKPSLALDQDVLRFRAEARAKRSGR